MTDANFDFSRFFHTHGGYLAYANVQRNKYAQYMPQGFFENWFVFEGLFDFILEAPLQVYFEEILVKSNSEVRILNFQNHNYCMHLYPFYWAKSNVRKVLCFFCAKSTEAGIVEDSVGRVIEKGAQFSE